MHHAENWFTEMNIHTDSENNEQKSYPFPGFGALFAGLGTNQTRIRNRRNFRMAAGENFAYQLPKYCW